MYPNLYIIDAFSDKKSPNHGSRRELNQSSESLEQMVEQVRNPTTNRLDPTARIF